MLPPVSPPLSLQPPARNKAGVTNQPLLAPSPSFGLQPNWQHINTEAFTCFRNGLLPNAVLAVVVTALPVGILALPHYAAGLVFAGTCALDTARGAVLGLCPWLNPMPHLKRLGVAALRLFGHG
jgi:hypothetical protein